MRSIQVHLTNAGLVGLGGTLGTLARFGIGQLITPAWAATLTVNLLGSFLMGLLVGALSTAGNSTAARSAALNSFAGAGFLGGFTTYSALATDTLALTQIHGTSGILLAAGSAALGSLLAGIGFALTRHHPADLVGETRAKS
ncbi:MAG: CrcB family protein [Trueperella sp.]|nr:CrcB family protein [Trueperella sp.]